MLTVVVSVLVDLFDISAPIEDTSRISELLCLSAGLMPEGSDLSKAWPQLPEGIPNRQTLGVSKIGTDRFSQG
jgi:hypothetical protein